jgi:hypothetical protein
MWSTKRPYRCHSCLWRGWTIEITATPPPFVNDRPFDPDALSRLTEPRRHN